MEDSRREDTPVDRGMLGRAVRKLLFTFLLISIISRRSGIFAAVCTGLPLTVAVLCVSDGTPFFRRFLLGLMWSAFGTTLGVAFMRLFGGYSLGAWLIPLLAGIILCPVYAALCRRISEKRLALSKCIVLIGMLLLCFVCG